MASGRTYLTYMWTPHITETISFFLPFSHLVIFFLLAGRTAGCRHRGLTATDRFCDGRSPTQPHGSARGSSSPAVEAHAVTRDGSRASSDGSCTANPACDRGSTWRQGGEIPKWRKGTGRAAAGVQGGAGRANAVVEKGDWPHHHQSGGKGLAAPSPEWRKGLAALSPEWTKGLAVAGDGCGVGLTATGAGERASAAMAVGMVWVVSESVSCVTSGSWIHFYLKS